MNELTIDATVNNIEAVTSFVEEKLAPFHLPVKSQRQINVAIDELFGNIALYAYNPDKGMAVVRVEFGDDPPSVTITFIDRGTPYDPLARPDPDVTLSAEQRQIGGLGIYMVKKSMDDVSYEYRDGQNILRITKNI